jgi:hypothetical protein
LGACEYVTLEKPCLLLNLEILTFIRRDLDTIYLICLDYTFV